MVYSRLASSELVLRVALLALLTGCGNVENTKAPQPVTASPSAAPVALAGLQLGYVWQTDKHNLYAVLGVTGATHYGSAMLPADGSVINAAATASLSSSWALLVHRDGTLQEWDLHGSASTILADRVPPDSSLMFSPSGTSAAVVNPSSQTALLVSGLPSKAQVASVLMPSGYVAGDIAVSDAGVLLVGVKS